MPGSLPPSLTVLQQKRKPFRDVNSEHKKSLSPLEKFALWITDNVGSMGFFFLILVWTIVWLLWNTYAPRVYRFDAYPAFVLWLFISNVIQLVLTPLIMVGQNLQSRHAEARAEADLEINVKSEEEIEAILQHLEYQNSLMLEILTRLDTHKNS